MLMSYWGNFTGNLGYLVSTQLQLIRSLIDAESLLALFQKKPTVKDGSRTFQFRRGAVDFHAVQFSYDGKKDIIKDFDFHAGPGQRIALVGETGGGKSTILKLLFRFYDVTQGSVRIDDQDVKDLTLESLRSCIGVVPQDPSMFNGTIMENVRYSKLDASDDEVIEACKGAAVHEKIESFTKRYASRVGEGGVKLSGGELQRIAIARVILKNPKIVLLDEATSAVDSETEAKIQGALEKLTRGRTTFTVAHRLSTVTNSDLILVIKAGEIVEKGSPKELIEAKGKYHELWLRQIGVVNAPEDEKTIEPELSNDLKTEEKGDVRRSSGDSSTLGNNNLRATAPAFIPRPEPISHYQRGPATKEGQASHDHGASGHQNSHDSANVKSNSGKNKATQKSEPVGDTDGASDSVDYLTGTSHPTEEATSKSAGGKQPMKAVQRRRNNKSEANGSALKNGQAAGPDEGMRQQPRRVSAPTPSGQQRRRRQRHIKIRDRQAGEGSSQAAPQSSTGGHFAPEA
jgi:ABC-type multidrug transport system ATPase subunit